MKKPGLNQKNRFFRFITKKPGFLPTLSHNISGEERPIAFASSTLSTAQKNYLQLDKEALSIIYELKRFHQYLYGRNFTIITDNKPLIHLFKPSAPAPMQAAARLQRWSLILAS